MRPAVGYVVVAGTVVVALFAMLWGWRYSVPDLLRLSYGLPLAWGVNTLETIAGPVDRWSIDLISLAVDLVFWFVTLIAAQFLASHRS
jgi:hypothetical protein